MGSSLELIICKSAISAMVWSSLSSEVAGVASVSCDLGIEVPTDNYMFCFHFKFYFVS